MLLSSADVFQTETFRKLISAIPSAYQLAWVQTGPGLEVIKLEFILRLKIKRNDWLLARVRKQPIISLYFESETF